MITAKPMPVHCGFHIKSGAATKVAGDIHEIEKNNLSPLLIGFSFTVHDLGVEVHPSEFLYKALKRGLTSSGFPDC